MSYIKSYYNDNEIDALLFEIVRQMYADRFRPDYIVGLTRGGLIPAVKLSHFLNVPMHPLNVQLRDGDGHLETNCWLAEEAYGILDSPKRILIVDDINDTGKTLQWIKDDWSSSCKPNPERWDYVWGISTKFAALIDNENSDFGEVNYVGRRINKLEKPEWIVFPWEEWWKTS